MSNGSLSVGRSVGRIFNFLSSDKFLFARKRLCLDGLMYAAIRCNVRLNWWHGVIISGITVIVIFHLLCIQLETQKTYDISSKCFRASDQSKEPMPPRHLASLRQRRPGRRTGKDHGRRVRTKLFPDALQLPHEKP